MTRSTIRRATVPPVNAGPRTAIPIPARPLAGAVLAVAAGLLLAGCSVGQVAETARKSPSVAGANATQDLRDADGNRIGSVAVRDVLVAYEGPAGYRRGGDAPLAARIFNDTRQAVTVRVTVATVDDQADGGSGQVVGAEAVALTGGTTTGSAGPAVPTKTGETTKTGGPAESAAPTGSAPPAIAAEPTGTPRVSGTPDASGTPSASGTAADPALPDARFVIPAGGFVALTPSGGRYLKVTGLRGKLTPGMSVPLRFSFSNGLELLVTAPVGNPLSAPERATPDAEKAGGEH